MARYKIVELMVGSCVICPKFRKYGRGATDICSITEKVVIDSRVIPDWCPLPDYNYEEEKKERG